MRTRPLAAALTTTGGLVVGADSDRYLCIHDAATGDVLFRMGFTSPAQDFPITYAVDGRQYLAIPVGGGRAPGVPNALYAFALPAE